MRGEMKHRLPFKVGQEAEARSFITGFRGAWFRCKIKNIGFKKGKLGYYLEFFDFLDEKITWTKVYQKPPKHTNKPRGVMKMDLMVRPSFPPWYKESELLDHHSTSGIVAIVDDTWKVGDLVDWWYDNCYWTGRVTQLLGEEKVLIELPQPPVGEGRSYCALCKDLRPSLDWSPENGWAIPISKEHEGCQYSVRLVHTHNQDSNAERINMSTDLESNDAMEGIHNCLYESSLSGNVKDSSDTEAMLNGLYDISCLRDEVTSSPDVLIENGKLNSFSKASSSSDEVKNSATMLMNSESIYRSSRYPLRYFDSFDNIWTDKQIYLTSIRHPDTLEASIFELEELAVKIRWLKGLLKFGLQWSNAMVPSWRFVENYNRTDMTS
ncbi:uncharacterized protein LOC109719548 isoform X2 [Ananas comosus]|uniref:Uncharacterized protein LOC109719548 isoform X2 n=1 Tax=Ananas comosus TaxID=4615 RepID=A0A6P5FZU4_ANACO|nr:uncharacterized protein LOC109719548 isoform X2 [Ananas comosus]